LAGVSFAATAAPPFLIDRVTALTALLSDDFSGFINAFRGQVGRLDRLRASYFKPSRTGAQCQTVSIPKGVRKAQELRNQIANLPQQVQFLK